MTTERVIIPFKDFLPDSRAINNPGLRRAWGAVPFYQNYLVSPGLRKIGTDLGQTAFITLNYFAGFHLHEYIASGQPAQLGYLAAGEFSTPATYLAEINLATGALTNRSSGAAYKRAPVRWHFTSYGPNVVATNLHDPTEVLTTPGSGAFAPLFTSTFKPQGLFPFTIRQNLFLAYCSLPANYGSLVAGTHPQLVVWSMNDTIDKMGSEAVDPALIGAGYQPEVGADSGPITGAIGGDFGIVFHRSGITRIDGPPYEFRTISSSIGCQQPDSIVRVDNDVYFWSTRGPAVLRGGEAPVEVLTDGAMTRSLLDSLTGFSEIAADLTPDPPFDDEAIVHVAVDRANGVIRWSYPTVGNEEFSDYTDETTTPVASSAFVDHNYIESRSGVSNVRITTGKVARVISMKTVTPPPATPWTPFGGVYGLVREIDPVTDSWTFWLVDLDLDSSPKPEVRFKTGLGLLKKNMTTRIRRVRPIYAKKPGATAVTVSAEIFSVNDPKDDEVGYGPFTTQDEMGWITTPEAIQADLHAVEIFIDPNATGDGKNVFEIEAVEIEFEYGSGYGA